MTDGDSTSNTTAHHERTILHVDMDAFYASVEIRERPELTGLPVVVGGDPYGRGVVSAASYAAREYGIHSAMPSAQARRLCPRAIFIRPRMSLYVDVSAQIREILERFSPLIEPLSLDEAFVDVSASRMLFGDGESIAQRIKSSIRNELSLVASIGVAPSKFIAKIASDLDKPDGLVIVGPGAEQAFLDPLPVSRLWGAGVVAQQALASMGIKTIGDLRRESQAALVDQFGALGKRLWALAHARDTREVVSDRAAKSVGHEVTFASDVEQLPELESKLNGLVEQVARRLRRNGLRARKVEVKIRYRGFDTVTRSRSFGHATDSTAAFWETARELLRLQFERRAEPVRLLGVSAGSLEGQDAPQAFEQADLFGDELEEAVSNDADKRKVDALSDQIFERFGPAAARRGRGLSKP